MRVFGISDLHLSFSSNKPMDIFGGHWENHADKMRESWDALVQPNDIVLVPGDLSWALKLDEAELDLRWIAERPGTKVLVRGNHDYWWQSISKVRAAIGDTCIALQNNAHDFGDFVVAGSRCWSVPGGPEYTAKDEKIYRREVGRLELSLKEAEKIRDGRILIAALHYPPLKPGARETEFSKLLDRFNVDLVVYGHLHGRASHKSANTGRINGRDYHLLSCDYLNFKPVEIPLRRFG